MLFETALSSILRNLDVELINLKMFCLLFSFICFGSCPVYFVLLLFFVCLQKFARFGFASIFLVF